MPAPKIRVPEEDVSPQLRQFIDSERPADVVLTAAQMEQVCQVMPPEMAPDDNVVSWYAHLDRGLEGEFCFVCYLPIMDWPSISDEHLEKSRQVLDSLGHKSKEAEVPVEIWASLSAIERMP